MYFGTYGFRRTWLDKYLKSGVFEDPSTSDMENGPKHSSKLNDSTFTIFIDPCEDNSAGKSFSELYAKPQDCLLTHWVPIISIPFLTEATNCNIFRCNYLRNRRYCLNCFFNFGNLAWILNIFKKKMALIAVVFLNLRPSENVVR